MVTTEIIFGVDETASNQLKLAKQIRYAVFCEEQQIPQNIEDDGLDTAAIHVLTSINGEYVATGRLLVAADDFIIGRVAVLPNFRGLHLGDLVVRILIRIAVDMGATEQIVHSQLQVQGFYEKLNFTPIGEVYQEANVPHITMVHKGDVFGKCAD
ncbi:MAG: GNAT family N-acetyltransferase [Defluviitaleaceae bacterium]|nr:GNAT family N-acetyltransferase [Defluviitaleaceae bacterium]